jgi:ribosomal protein S18 acetylase RimI-like enzyme
MKDGIKPCYGLHEKELKEIKELSLLCNEADGIRLKLNWDMLRERRPEQNNDFLYYKNGVLAGFLGMYSFNSNEMEISGMVHPDYRRLGIFQELTGAAVEACRRRSIPKLILICSRSSVSGRAFLDALGSTYSFSEYRMDMLERLAGAQMSAFKQAAAGDIRLRKAKHSDIELLIQLNMSGFSMSEQDAREYVIASLEGKGETTYIAGLWEMPIGKISVQLSDVSGFIYGFCVQPEYRGKGHGSQIFARTILSIREQEPDIPLVLEVAVDNEKALGLYQSCGFKEVVAYDYYELYL